MTTEPLAPDAESGEPEPPLPTPHEIESRIYAMARRYERVRTAITLVAALLGAIALGYLIGVASSSDRALTILEEANGPVARQRTNDILRYLIAKGECDNLAANQQSYNAAVKTVFEALEEPVPAPIDLTSAAPACLRERELRSAFDAFTASVRQAQQREDGGG